MHRCNGTFLLQNYLRVLTKVCERYAPLEWHLPPLNFTLERLTKGMRRWNGTFLPYILQSGGSQNKVRYLGILL